MDQFNFWWWHRSFLWINRNGQTESVCNERLSKINKSEWFKPRTASFKHTWLEIRRINNSLTHWTDIWLSNMLTVLLCEYLFERIQKNQYTCLESSTDRKHHNESKIWRLQSISSPLPVKKVLSLQPDVFCCCSTFLMWRLWQKALQWQIWCAVNSKTAELRSLTAVLVLLWSLSLKIYIFSFISNTQRKQRSKMSWWFSTAKVFVVHHKNRKLPFSQHEYLFPKVQFNSFKRYK